MFRHMSYCLVDLIPVSAPGHLCNVESLRKQHLAYKQIVLATLPSCKDLQSQHLARDVLLAQFHQAYVSANRALKSQQVSSEAFQAYK